MTNGEKIKEIFPTFEFIKETEKDRTPQHQFLKVHGVNKMPYMEFDLGWWNAESKEPTSKNDLVLIHTEGLDEEIRCTMCTNSMKSDRGCDGSCVVNKDMYKAVMNAIEKRIQPSVTPQEPRKGHWIDDTKYGGTECSECGKWYPHATIAKIEIKYCSECSAKMEIEK